MIREAIAIAVGLTVLIAVFSLAPVIGNSVEGIANLSGTNWDPETGDYTTGADLWGQNSTILSIVVLISIISLAIFTLMRLGGGGME